jgi:hypothetical protein
VLLLQLMLLLLLLMLMLMLQQTSAGLVFARRTIYSFINH